MEQVFNFLNQCRLAKEPKALETLTQTLVSTLDSLEDIELSACMRNGQTTQVNRMSGTGCPHHRNLHKAPGPDRTKVICAPEHQYMCTALATAELNVDHEHGAACQKGEGQIESTCLDLIFSNPQPSNEDLDMLRKVLPHLHDAVTRVVGSQSTKPGEYHLTVREQEVLHWVREGKTNWEISQILSLSERTVKFHVSNLLAKLGITRRAQAAAMASEMSPYKMSPYKMSV